MIGGFAAQLRELVVEQPTWAGRFAVIDQLLERRAAEVEADRRARSGRRSATPGGGCEKPGAASA